MQTFIKIDRSEQNKKDVFTRIKNYKEVYETFSIEKAASQSSRCVQCGDPYCMALGCPLDNFIPHWLKSTAEDSLQNSFKISNETSPFPEILGRICPHDKLCEGNCTLEQDGYRAVTIGAIETAITERGFEAGFEIDFPGITTNKKVAVIGSGPSGISAANFLLRAGIKVTMYEKDKVAGGLLVWGIPGFKLDKSVVERRFKILQNAGLELITNCEVGKDISFEEIRKTHDAVYIAVGASKSNSLKLENEKAKGVVFAIDFLRGIQSKLFNDNSNKFYSVKDKKVIVIGGGDTAMDCVRSSVREGAKSVRCVYRRDEKNMPGSKKEYINAGEEGVEFTFLASPKKINVDKNNRVKSVTFVKMKLTNSDESGRQKVQEIKNSEFEEEADVVVLALGFSHQKLSFLKESNIELNEWGGLKTNENKMTSLDMVYSGGDCVRGANLAVSAARDGRDAAFDIIKKLKI